MYFIKQINFIARRSGPVSQTDEKFVNVKNSWIRNSSLDDYVIAFRKKSVSIKRQFSNEKYGWRNTVAVALAFFNNSGIALVSMD
jgi:hypothetical protein